MPSPKTGSRERLRSYGGDVVDATVHSPRSVEELRGLLRAARDDGSRVTFRGGGCAFDTQSLNDDVVISMTAMKSIEVDPVGATVTADAGATWGEIVRATLPRGLVPYVLVTTRNATIAGTASSDCLSRFSPTCGKEGAHIVSFDLLTVDGRLLRCSREENAEVFFAAVGGLGYLGAITRATYRLLPLGHAPRVETVVTPYLSLREFVTALVPKGAAVEGLYGASFGQRALHFRSRYVEPGERRRPLWLLHQPRSPVRALVDLLLRAQVLNRAGSWLTFNVVSGRARTYVDAFEDYAFFMDGNSFAKAIGRAFGAPMRMLQQTFVLPVHGYDPSPARSTRDLAAFEASIDGAIGFMNDLSAELGAEGVQPTMYDCLFLPRDEGFLLSSSAHLDGLALSVAFDTSNERILRKVRKTLTAASARCRAIGGRVHLIKNVCAAPDDLAAMYREGAEAFFELKRRLDPTGVLRNEFLERIFPAQARALGMTGTTVPPAATTESEPPVAALAG
jgi:decaprenylphospho-beta-D-ribofuranose 2-oxidase